METSQRAGELENHGKEQELILKAFVPMIYWGAAYISSSVGWYQLEADMLEDLHFRMKYPGGTVCSAWKIVRVGIVIHQPRDDNTSTLVHHLLLLICDVFWVIVCDYMWSHMILEDWWQHDRKIECSKPLLHVRMYFTSVLLVLSVHTGIFAIKSSQLTFVSFQEPTVILGYFTRRQL